MLATNSNVDLAAPAVVTEPVLERPPEDRAEDQARNVIRNLRVAFRIIRDHSRWVERQCGVSATQLWTLREVAYQPGIRISNLSRALSIHLSTASNLLDKLEEKGLIRRNRGSSDQREVRVTLTDAGRLLLDQAPGPKQGLFREALSRMPNSALEELDRGLVALLQQTPLRDLAKPEPLSGTES
ncbi:MAG: MarR family winged helix-turn-helix transcriptional regulator [Candidatus Neomarinimicrobiota bacterium]